MERRFSIEPDQARTGIEVCDVYFSDKSPLLYRYAVSIQQFLITLLSPPLEKFR